MRALAREVPLAIASGALHGEIERILSAGGLRDAFTAIVAADDVTRGKPHPEPYLTAMAAVAPLAPGLAAEDCLVVEDSMPGHRRRPGGGDEGAGGGHLLFPRAPHRRPSRGPALAGLQVADLRALFG